MGGRPSHRLRGRIPTLALKRRLPATPRFETDKADGFREPGFSKERRLELQITGLLTDETIYRRITSRGGISQAYSLPVAVFPSRKSHRSRRTRRVHCAGWASVPVVSRSALSNMSSTTAS